MDDEHFRALTEAMLRGQSREAQRPLPVRKALAKRSEPKPPRTGDEEPTARELVRMRLRAREIEKEIAELEQSAATVREAGASKAEIRGADKLVREERRTLAKVNRRIDKLQTAANAAADVLHAMVGLTGPAIERDEKWARDRERKLKKLERPTRTIKVESPYGRQYADDDGRLHNRPDRVERVVDTIELMLKAHQIDRDQESAARMVQDAWAAAPGNIRCALAAGEGGAGPGSRSPTEGQLWAGRILNDVREELGRLDSLVVIRICGLGFSIEQAARMIFAVPDTLRVSDRQRDHVGMRLRMALAVMAKHWKIGARKPKVGVGSANNRSASARHDEFTLKSFATKHAPVVRLDIGTLADGNRHEIDTQRERERLLGEREARRVRRPRKKGGALP